jgi:uncharacterized protein (TIGR02231 family)
MNTRPTWLALLVASAGAIAPGAARAAGEGAVDEVVVFADRARVTRTRVAKCEAGRARAAFEGLPATLDARTLRGDVREAAEVVGVSTGDVHQASAPDARVAALEAELRKVDASIRAEEARQAELRASMDRLDAYDGVFGATFAEELRNPKPATGAWGGALDGLRARRAALWDKSRAGAIALRKLRREQDRLARELRHLAPDGAARASRTAIVTIDCRRFSQVTAALSYVVPGATWQPEYDLDFSPSGHAKVGPGTARLTVGAVVRQSTGEDWTGARVSLSTAKPKLGVEAPLPAPLVVTGNEENRDKVLVQAQERREQLEGGAGAASGSVQSASLDDKGNVFVLTLPHRVTIVADGRPTWAPIDVVSAPAVSRRVAWPKLAERVFQIVSLKNPAAYPLLDGRVRAYRAGSYVGVANLRYRGVGEPLEISIGADDELKVERQTIEDKARDPRFLSSTKQFTQAYRALLTSRAAEATTVEIREHIPVSKIADVKVELVPARMYGGYKLDAERGFVTWTIPLASGERKAVDLAYTIKLPDDWQVGR